MDKKLNSNEINEKLINTKKGIEDIVQKRYSAVAEIKVCQSNVHNIVEEIKSLGVDPKHVGDAIKQIDEEIEANLKELEAIDAVVEKYRELDISTVKDMEELNSLNLDQDF